MEVKQIKVIATVGMVTLMGTLKTEYPIQHGNRFTLKYKKEDYWVENMYCENFDHLIEMNIIQENEPLDCLLVGSSQLHIFDQRIPEEYYHE